MFVALLLKALSGAASAEISHLLEKFRELNGDEKYFQLVVAMRNSFTLLLDVVDNTKTKIDDTLVQIILDALPEIEETPAVVVTDTGTGTGSEESKPISLAKNEPDESGESL